MKRIHAFGLLLAAFATQANAEAVYTYTGKFFNSFYRDGIDPPGSHSA